MKYIVRDTDGTELGPYEQKEIEQYILERRIDGQTEIRTDLLPQWSKLEKVGVFAKVLAAVPPLEKTPEEIEAERPKTLGEKISAWLCVGYKEVEPTEKDTAFKNKPVPHVGGPVLRLCAGLTDFIILLLMMLVLVVFGLRGLYSTAESVTLKSAPAVAENADNADAAAPADNKGKADAAQPKAQKADTAENADTAAAEAGAEDENAAPAPEDTRKNNLNAATAPSVNDDMNQDYSFGSLWVVTGSGEKYACIDNSVGEAKWVPVSEIGSVLHWYMAFAIFIFALYYGLSLGYYAQTAGMWYWGLFVLKKDNTEVHFFRAALFAFLVPWFGWLTIITGWFGGWGVHDHLSGVKVIRTVPRSRY